MARGLKILLGAAGAIVLGLGACRALLPERMAVNVPLGQFLFGRGVAPPDASAFGTRIQVAQGFEVALWAELPRLRFLVPTPAGDLLATQPFEDRVMRLRADRDGDGRSDGTDTLLEGLDGPHGLDLHDGWLYVAERDAIARVRFDAEGGAVSGEVERVVTGLPRGGNHWKRVVRVGPDDHLYVSIGSSCNVCEEEDRRRGAMLRFTLEGEPAGSPGTDDGLWATGLRNSAGYDWQPGTGDLYATDNGRDLLGDDFPPCELNRVVEGGFYGWPRANGDRIPDPDLGAGHEAAIAASIPPAHGFRAHNAPLGMTFLEGAALPARYRGAALAALHGSWNRTQKDGYEVVSLHWAADGSIEERRFLWGFLEDDDVIGRPVDVAQGADGAIYVSDDYAGSVYRVAPAAAAATR